MKKVNTLSVVLRATVVLLGTIASLPIAIAQTPGIEIEEYIVEGRCACQGSITITYNVLDPAYTPQSFTWYAEGSPDPIATTQNISNVCAGKVTLKISFADQAPLENTFEVEAKDLDAPVLFDVSTLFSGIESFIEDGDTRYYYFDCEYNVEDAENNITYLDQHLIEYASDGCDTFLEILPQPIQYENPNIPLEEIFLASREYIVRDDAGNETKAIFMFVVSIVYQPKFNYILWKGQELGIVDNNLDKEIIIGVNEPLELTANASPVCKTNNLTYKWNFDNDGDVDANTSSVSPTWDTPGTYFMTVTAFIDFLGNGQSADVNIKVTVVSGLSVKETINAASCGKSNGAILMDITFSTNVEATSFAWLDAGQNIVASTRDLSNVPPGRYTLSITLSDGSTYTSKQYEVTDKGDSEKPTVDAQAVADLVKDRMGDKEGYLRYVYPNSDNTIIEVTVFCEVSIANVDAYLKALENDVRQKASDNCDSDLQVVPGPIKHTDPNYNNFLGSQEFTVIDDVGNQTNLNIVFIADVGGVPRFNELLIDGIPTPVNGEFVTICVEKGKPVKISANVTPQCTSTTVEIKWDIGNDDTYDAVGTLTHTWNEPTVIKVTAFTKGFVNGVVHLKIDLGFSGLRTTFDIKGDCETKCKNKVTLISSACGPDLRIYQVQWYRAADNVKIDEGFFSENLCAGNYIVKMYVDDGTVRTEPFTVPDILSMTSASDPVRCFGGTDGVITLQTTGGSGDFTFEVKKDNVPVSTDAKTGGLKAGKYGVAVLDNITTCRIEKEVTVDDGVPLPVASFTATPRTGDGIEPLTFRFTNMSTNADSYRWDFGDSQASTDSGEEIDHTYQQEGNYPVELTAYNKAGCIDAYSREVTVSEVVTAIDLTEAPAMSLYPNPVVDILYLRLPGFVVTADWQILDALGKTNVKAQSSTIVQSDILNVDVSDLLDGIYMLKIQHSDQTYIFRFIKL